MKKDELVSAALELFMENGYVANKHLALHPWVDERIVKQLKDKTVPK